MMVLLLPILYCSTLVTHTFGMLAFISLVGTFLSVVRWALYKGPTIETVAQTILQVPSYLVQGSANFFLSLFWTRDQANLRDYAKYLVATFGPRKALPASPTYAKHVNVKTWSSSFGGLLAYAVSLPAIPLVWAHRIAFGGTMPLMLPAPPVMEPANKPKQSLFHKIWTALMLPMVLFSAIIQRIILPFICALFTWVVKPLCSKAIPIIFYLMIMVAPSILGILLEVLDLFFVSLLFSAIQDRKEPPRMAECSSALDLTPKDLRNRNGLEDEFKLVRVSQTVPQRPSRQGRNSRNFLRGQ